MRKAGESRAQPERGPCWLCLTPHLGLLILTRGGDTSLRLFLPLPLVPLSRLCASAPILSLSRELSSQASLLLSRAHHARLQNHSPTARASQFKVRLISLLQKDGESLMPLGISKLGIEVASPHPHCFMQTLHSPSSDSALTPATRGAFRLSFYNAGCQLPLNVPRKA